MMDASNPSRPLMTESHQSPREQRVPTYAMAERSGQADFFIRDENGGPRANSLHRHEYFQIQINLAGDTVQHIGATVRPFKAGTLAFVLPHRMHLIPHPEGGRHVLINFTQEFLLPHLHCDPLDLEDVPFSEALELAPFRFQEHLDFVLDETDFVELQRLLTDMRQWDQRTALGSALQLKACLLQLIALVCARYQAELIEMAHLQVQRRGRRDALSRVQKYIRTQLSDPQLNLKSAAAAAFLSPNYLTHLLRKETGHSFTDLVLERRLRLARSLLLQAQKTIGQVAWACGFADEAYFSRCFRKAFKQSPSQFRKSQARGD